MQSEVGDDMPIVVELVTEQSEDLTLSIVHGVAFRREVRHPSPPSSPLLSPTRQDSNEAAINWRLEIPEPTDREPTGRLPRRVSVGWRCRSGAPRSSASGPRGTRTRPERT